MRKRATPTALLGLAALAAQSFASCSEADCSETRSCEDQTTGGSAGSGFDGSGGAGGDSGGAGGGFGGSAGSGAAAGSDGGVECTNQSECQNGLGCDGTEQCLEGRCVPGQPFQCTNPDSVACDVVCAEAMGQAACNITGADRDVDGHGSAACPVNAGDDCDDAEKGTYPGASEVCDGLDNDCDGNNDLDDGFALAGTAGLLVNSTGDADAPSVDWSSAASVYGVAWSDTRNAGNSEIYFARMDAQGAKIGSDVRVTTGGGVSTSWVAADSSGFGVVWADTHVWFRRLDSAGAPSGSAVRLDQGAGPVSVPRVAAVPGGGHVAVWVDARSTIDRVYVRRVDANGAVMGSNVAVTTGPLEAANPFVAASSGGFAVSFQRYDTMTIETALARLDLSLGVLGTDQLSPGLTAAVRATASGYVAAWDVGVASVAVHRLNSSGSQTCGDSLSGSGLVADVAGELALVMESGAPARLVQLDASCQTRGPYELSPPISNLTYGSIARGSAGYAVVWSETSGGRKKIYRRTFGTNLCD